MKRLLVLVLLVCAGNVFGASSVAEAMADRASSSAASSSSAAASSSSVFGGCVSDVSVSAELKKRRRMPHLAKLKKLCAKAIAERPKLVQESVDLMTPLLRKDIFIEYVGKALRKRIGYKKQYLEDPSSACRNISEVAFSHDGDTLASLGVKTVCLWNTQTGALAHVLEGEFGLIKFSPTASMLAIAEENDGRIHLWNSATGVRCQVLECAAQEIKSMDFSPDGKILASVDLNGIIYLWDLQAGTCEQTFKGHAGGCIQIAFSPNGKALALASEEDETICLWSVHSGVCFQTLKGHTGGIKDMAFSPDGRTLATASFDETIRLWDYCIGDCRKILNRDQVIFGPTPFRSIAFSPDGSILASTSWKKPYSGVTLWNPYTGSQINRISRSLWHKKPKMAFSPDGRIIATRGCNGSVLVSDAHTGDGIALMGASNCSSPPYSNVAFSPDGKLFAASNEMGDKIRLWRSYREDLKEFAYSDEIQKKLIAAAHDWHADRPYSVGDTDCTYQALADKLTWLNHSALSSKKSVML